MDKITVIETNPTLCSLIDKVNESHQATLITVANNKKAIAATSRANSGKKGYLTNV